MPLSVQVIIGNRSCLSCRGGAWTAIACHFSCNFYQQICEAGVHVYGCVWLVGMLAMHRLSKFTKWLSPIGDIG